MISHFSCYIFTESYYNYNYRDYYYPSSASDVSADSLEDPEVTSWLGEDEEELEPSDRTERSVDGREKRSAAIVAEDMMGDSLRRHGMPGERRNKRDLTEDDIREELLR